MMRSPGRTTLAMVALACVPAPQLIAQATPSEPRLYLTVLGGYRVGRPLWSLGHQLFAIRVPGTVIADTVVVAGPGLYDTLTLQREFTPSFVVGVSGTYFPGPHLGFQGEFAFLGMGLESRCTIRQTQPPYPGDLDPALCASLDGQSVATSAVSIAVGVVGRLTPGRGTYPYVRATGGFITRTHGTIDLVGLYPTANDVATATVVADPHAPNTALHLTLGAGVAVTMGTGYQVWFEGRDVVSQMERVTGPADPNGPSGVLVPPHGSRLFHNFVFAIGLDVVFEKQRRRRY